MLYGESRSRLLLRGTIERARVIQTSGRERLRLCGSANARGAMACRLLMIDVISLVERVSDQPENLGGRKGF